MSQNKRKNEDCASQYDDDLDVRPSCSNAKRTRKCSADSIYCNSVESSISAMPQDRGPSDRIERVREIIAREFEREIKFKESQLELIDERLEEAFDHIERLRYAIVADYYRKQELRNTMVEVAPTMNCSSTQIDKEQRLKQIANHPSIKKIIGKRPQNLEEIMGVCPKRAAAKNAKHVLIKKTTAERREEKRLQKIIREQGIVIDHTKQGVEIKREPDAHNSTQLDVKPTVDNSAERPICGPTSPNRNALNSTRLSNHTKYYFVVGNTSKYIGGSGSVDDRTQINANTFSHKWLVYVQMKDLKGQIDRYIKKVRFFLHPSYRPNDIVDIHTPPFQVARRGWGEFPIRIQLFFHDKFKQKPVQLIHTVVLDTTRSGRHTLGAETTVEVWLRTEVTATANVKEEQREHAAMQKTSATTITEAMTTTATVTKPRTISFTNIKEFDDNFFDFLNKIEETRSSICADIEKIEPTVIVNETLDANALAASPKKSELRRSPLKKTPPISNPLRSAAVSNVNRKNLVQNPETSNSRPQLPQAIKDAANKLHAAIAPNNVGNISPNGMLPSKNIPETNIKLIAATKSIATSNIAENVTTPSAVIVKTISNNTETPTLKSTAVSPTIFPIRSSAATAIIKKNAQGLVPAMGKVFNNVSGTVILPLGKQHTKEYPTASSVISNGALPKTILQKKMIQVVDAQGRVKSVPMLVAVSNATNRIVTTQALNTFANTNSTKPVEITTPKAITSTNLVKQATIPNKPNTITVSSPKVMLIDTVVSSTSSASTPLSTSLTQQATTLTTNVQNSVRTITTSTAKNVVFQKEGKLYIIDPFQMKLKQQQKNQVSLLKPQLKEQHKQLKQQLQQKASTLETISSDHDYAPPPATQPTSSTSLFSEAKDNAEMRAPQVHLGIRETRLKATNAQSQQQEMRIRFENKLHAMNFSSIRAAVEYLLRQLPLIVTATEPAAAAAFPFARRTLQEFQMLPAFKQRSCEWLRAKFIARFIRSLKSLQQLVATSSDTYWSTREIAAFARIFAYTPPIKTLQQLPNLDGDVTSLPGTKEHFAALIKSEMKSEQLQLEYDTLSPAVSITEWLDSKQQHLQQYEREINENEVIVIDAVSDNECTKPPEENASSEMNVTKRIYGSPLKFETSRDDLLYLPPLESLESAFQLVGDMCQDVSIRLRPEEISPGVVHPAAQTLLAKSLQILVERLLRQSIGNQMQQQQQQQPQYAISELSYNAVNCSITSQDVRKAIAQCVELDFLTNRHLGVSRQFIKKEQE